MNYGPHASITFHVGQVNEASTLICKSSRRIRVHYRTILIVLLLASNSFLPLKALFCQPRINNPRGEKNEATKTHEKLYFCSAFGRILFRKVKLLRGCALSIREEESRNGLNGGYNIFRGSGSARRSTKIRCQIASASRMSRNRASMKPDFMAAH